MKSNSDLVSSCGIYCGACHRYKKKKCPGCAQNRSATWCKIRTCTSERQIRTCAECAEFSNVNQCRKFNTLFAKFFALVFRSDRPASLKKIQLTSLDDYAEYMAEIDRPVLKKGE